MPVSSGAPSKKETTITLQQQQLAAFTPQELSGHPLSAEHLGTLAYTCTACFIAMKAQHTRVTTYSGYDQVRLPGNHTCAVCCISGTFTSSGSGASISSTAASGCSQAKLVRLCKLTAGGPAVRLVSQLQNHTDPANMWLPQAIAALRDWGPKDRTLNPSCSAADQSVLPSI